MNLVFCIHNHQPVGNMDFILEEAYSRSYLPFFEVLSNFSQIHVGLHFSGFLFSWLCEHKPDYIVLLKKLKERGQLEIIAGGMYEPVLSLLPEEDGITQIQAHADYMAEVFGDRPKGMWLAERVYEPHMPGILSKAGISYTLVDDNHFKAVGMAEEELYGYFISEFGGERIFIFPGLEVLRYAIPFKPMDQVDRCFREIAAKGGDLAVFGDDGEKFGLWPGTYASVYEEKWLVRFFTYLTDQADWLKTVTFSEYMEKHPPKGLVYLDCQSYKEMGEWSLPARLTNRYSLRINSDDPEKRSFLKGGYFKNFLVKYSESNDMHKKMLSLAGKARGNVEATRHVQMAQANDSYWHGVFGGLYLPHLRASVYSHLIEAERILDPEEGFVDGRMEDINVDGLDEAILENKQIQAIFLPHEGGVMYGLDFKPTCTNLLATLSRRYEGYHEKVKEATSPAAADGTKTIHDLVIAKEKGLENLLFYDWHRRGSFLDHVMGTDASLESVFRSKYLEPGDFVKEPYSCCIDGDGSGVRLFLTRKGHFWKGGNASPLILEKRMQPEKNGDAISADYRLEGEVQESFRLGVEFNFALLGSGGDRYLGIDGKRHALTGQEVFESVSKVMVHDPYQRINAYLEFDSPVEVWTFPVEVVSLSEQGFERNYQSTMVMPLWDIDLRRGPVKFLVTLRLQEI
jgi:4-alpha-glucanotransferase